MRRVCMLAVLCSALLLLAGCDIRTGDDLLALPRPSKNYYALQEELETIQAEGAVYSAPQSGQNRNTVQLVDLDNDQEDEAIAFFRESTNSNQFNIYVFKKIGDEYVRMDSVIGSGLAINSVEYPVITADGKRGIVLSWLLPGEMTSMTMCGFEGGRLRQMLSTDYTAYVLPDLDRDGAQELAVIRADANGQFSARLYHCGVSEMRDLGEVLLAPEARSIVSLDVGMIADGMCAIFVEEKIESGSGMLTDILILENGLLRNLTLNTEASSEQSTYRAVSVMATDINGDQITEIPLARLAAGSQDVDPANAFYILDWYVYAADEEPRRVMTTYQNIAERWQLTLDDDWRARISISKTSEDGSAVTAFSEYLGDGGSTPVLLVYRLTGAARNYYAARDGMIELASTSDEIFCARIPEDAARSELAISEDTLRARFSLIQQEWD